MLKRKQPEDSSLDTLFSKWYTSNMKLSASSICIVIPPNSTNTVLCIPGPICGQITMNGMPIFGQLNETIDPLQSEQQDKHVESQVAERQCEEQYKNVEQQDVEQQTKEQDVEQQDRDDEQDDDFEPTFFEPTSESTSFDPISFEPTSFEPTSFEPKSFEPKSFEPIDSCGQISDIHADQLRLCLQVAYEEANKVVLPDRFTLSVPTMRLTNIVISKMQTIAPSFDLLVAKCLHLSSVRFNPEFQLVGVQYFKDEQEEFIGSDQMSKHKRKLSKHSMGFLFSLADSEIFVCLKQNGMLSINGTRSFRHVIAMGLAIHLLLHLESSQVSSVIDSFLFQCVSGPFLEPSNLFASFAPTFLANVVDLKKNVWLNPKRIVEIVVQTRQLHDPIYLIRVDHSRITYVSFYQDLCEKNKKQLFTCNLSRSGFASIAGFKSLKTLEFVHAWFKQLFELYLDDCDSGTDEQTFYCTHYF